MAIDSFAVLVAFLYALFYTTCLSFLLFFFSKKTSVNTQPLNPSFLQEFGFVAFVFFYVFIFLLIFGYPLPTSWARLVSFWIDVDVIVGLTFPRFPLPALNFCRAFARNLLRTYRELARNLQEMRRTCRELATNLCKELPPKQNRKQRIPFIDATATATNLQL